MLQVPPTQRCKVQPCLKMSNSQSFIEQQESNWQTSLTGVNCFESFFHSLWKAKAEGLLELRKPLTVISNSSEFDFSLENAATLLLSPSPHQGFPPLTPKAYTWNSSNPFLVKESRQHRLSSFAGSFSNIYTSYFMLEVLELL